MEAYQALRAAAKLSGTALTDIGPKLGHNRSYASTLICQNGDPRTSTLTALLDACGWELVAVPKGKAPSTAIKLG